MAIEGINVENWRAKPLKEVVNNMDVVEEQDTEVAQWAQAMAAVGNAPDNVTYNMAGGSTEDFTAELEAITQNGLPIEEQPEDGAPQDVEVVGQTDEVPPEEEEPPVGTPDDGTNPNEQTEAQAATANDPNAPPQDVAESETAVDATTEEDVTLADESITTDNEEIEKRKRRRGEQPQQ